MMKLQTAMIAAQQAAIKPGDEALPCAALRQRARVDDEQSGHPGVRGEDEYRVRKELATQHRRRRQ